MEGAVELHGLLERGRGGEGSEALHLAVRSRGAAFRSVAANILGHAADVALLQAGVPLGAHLVAGADAHSRYYSEDVRAKAPDTVDLVIVPGADHVDLYDRKDVVPFDKLDAFFTKNLA
ncbi:alpha/beta hydrolase family protein [Streptomyces flaveolus]|uniref:hypothetical protein n=1 Tax=Streptomyces flaveolus TaxID=67297 RepID=UPI003700EBE2